MTKPFLPRTAVAIAAAVWLTLVVSTQAATSVDPQQINKSFEIALQEMAVGEARRAIPRLRAILALDPTLVRVRLELARALYLAGDLHEARGQFLIALSGKDVPGAVKKNVLRFVRAIDTRRGFTKSFRLALTTPTGGGRSYDSNAVYVDLFGTGSPLQFDLNRPKAPRLAAMLDASARQLWPLGRFSRKGGYAVYLRGHANLVDASGSALDEAQIDIAPGLQFSWPRTTLSLEARLSGYYTAGSYSERRVGPAITFATRNDTGLSFAADVVVRKATNLQSASYDGTQTEADFRLQKAMRGNGFYAAELTLERRSAHRKDYSYGDAVLRVSRQVDLRGGLAIDASVYGELYLQGTATPGFPRRRLEHEYGFDITAEKTDYLVWNRYVPYVSIGASRRISTVTAYGYKEFRCQIGVRSAL